jgi:predicted nucleic acid-binding protein
MLKIGINVICLDTTFLIDLWRNAGNSDHPAVIVLNKHKGEMFAVPSHAAGEFLEGAANISEERYQESVRFLRLFQIGILGFETAKKYARIVSMLRAKSLLHGISKPDMWIAAWALEHGSILITRNQKYFREVPDLKLYDY